jgi:hypothetical protein
MLVKSTMPKTTSSSITLLTKTAPHTMGKAAPAREAMFPFTEEFTQISHLFTQRAHFFQHILFFISKPDLQRFDNTIEVIG